MAGFLQSSALLKLASTVIGLDMGGDNQFAGLDIVGGKFSVKSTY